MIPFLWNRHENASNSNWFIITASLRWDYHVGPVNEMQFKRIINFSLVYILIQLSHALQHSLDYWLEAINLVTQ